MGGGVGGLPIRRPATISGAHMPPTPTGAAAAAGAGTGGTAGAGVAGAAAAGGLGHLHHLQQQQQMGVFKSEAAKRMAWLSEKQDAELSTMRDQSSTWFLLQVCLCG